MGLLTNYQSTPTSNIKWQQRKMEMGKIKNPTAEPNPLLSNCCALEA